MNETGGSVYDEIGGGGVMKAAVTVFYERVVSDPLLAPWFEGIDLSRLRAHQRAFLAAALGGPPLFSGRSLTDAHAGMAITDDAYDAIVEHLGVSLHDLGVADEAIDVVRARLADLRDDIVTA